MPIRVNLGRLRTRFGSTNSGKRSKIRRACAGIAANVDDLFEENDPAYMDLVEELLDGKATHENMGAKYWYAIKEMAESLGKWLNNSEWYPASPDLFWNHSAIHLYDIDAPMIVPSPDDFPAVFTLRNADMTDELLEEFKNLIEDEAQFRQFSGWVTDARRYKQDLLMFYY